MSVATSTMRCPHSGATSPMGGQCPMAASHTRMGPRGCAFAGFSQTSAQMLFGAPQGPDAAAILQAREQKTMIDLLLPEAPSKEKVKGLKNADCLVPSNDDVLAAALGAPARRVLLRAESLGPVTGWRDGYLTSMMGFCPPDPSASPIALAGSPGRVWSDLCERMPGLVGRGKIREAILELPLISGGPESIPDDALWAATVCLGILASVYRYEERNDGREGIVTGATPAAFTNAAGDAPDEEEETKGIPRNIAIPLRQISQRMGRPLPHLTQMDVSVINYKIRDHTSVFPYPQRAENMDLRWPVFNDRAEAMFLLCMAEVHGVFSNGGIEHIARCQEAVMNKDNDTLLRELIAVKELVDQLGYVFHKISVNPRSGELFANPVEWGQRYAKFSAPLSSRVPALSGLALPIFQLLDAFLGRKKYDTFLGIEALHLRAWLPLNHRAFITAIENFYQVPAYVLASGDHRLIGVLEGLVESYAGERGFMGTHRYKVYGFLEVVARTGRTETNGGAGAADNVGRPWEEVHKTLSESMLERLEPFRRQISLQPHEMRGCFEECRFRARLMKRSWIDTDPDRMTARVTIDISDCGITFGPGDRLAIMPLNSLTEAAKVADALGLLERLDEAIPLDKADDWKRFSMHEITVSKSEKAGIITLRDILRKGHLQPLAKETVMAVHVLLRAASGYLLKLLSSDTWPLTGSLGDILQVAKRDVSADIWEAAFDREDLSWIPKFIPVEVPRTYSISSFSEDYLPNTIDLTVARAEHTLSPLITGGAKLLRAGVGSGFLNPHPEKEKTAYGDNEQVLIGVSRPLNFQLPISPAAPVVMFAGGSGIAPFRSFWKARIAGRGVGRNILFLGVQSRKKFSYEEELRDHVAYDGLEVHTAFSRDRNGLVYDPSSRSLVEKEKEPCYLNTVIAEKGATVCDMVMSKKLGGLGGHLYICGSTAFYDTVISGIRQAIYNNRTVTQEAADGILATAFAERRFMLDIFMTPQAMSLKEPVIPLSTLARHTGHREGSKMWIGVHGSVYDITDFLPIHPGGSLIAAASAGLDASKTFDNVAHTSNPEVMSLLSKYFIGYLAPKPTFHAAELSNLYDDWKGYLNTCVENLTTLSFEVNSIMQDEHIWFSGGLLNMGGVRKFYQFESRLIQNGFDALFKKSLQELYVKLTFAIVAAQGQSIKLPDVMGIVARAQSSTAAAQVKKEIAHIGEMVCSSATAQSFEKGILRYAQGATELSVRLLEQIREEVCAGMDGFDLVLSMKGGAAAEKSSIGKLSMFLISLLERIAERLDTFYKELAQLSIYHPEMEANPARARWRLVRRRIQDGSFFVFTQELSLDAPSSTFEEGLAQLSSSGEIGTSQMLVAPLKLRRPRDSISFEAIMASAQPLPTPPLPTVIAQPAAQEPQQPPTRSLAKAHTLRAAASAQTTSYAAHLEQAASNRISMFMQQNLKAIRRLSKVTPENVSLLDAALQRINPTSTAPHSRSGSESTVRSGSTMASGRQEVAVQVQAPRKPSVGALQIVKMPGAPTPAPAATLKGHSRSATESAMLRALNETEKALPSFPSPGPGFAARPPSPPPSPPEEEREEYAPSIPTELPPPPVPKPQQQQPLQSNFPTPPAPPVPPQKPTLHPLQTQQPPTLPSGGPAGMRRKNTLTNSPASATSTASPGGLTAGTGTGTGMPRRQLSTTGGKPDRSLARMTMASNAGSSGMGLQHVMEMGPGYASYNTENGVTWGGGQQAQVQGYDGRRREEMEGTPGQSIAGSVRGGGSGSGASERSGGLGSLKGSMRGRMKAAVAGAAGGRGDQMSRALEILRGKS